MFRNVLVFVFALMFVGAGGGLSAGTQDAVLDRLAHVEMFALGGIGFALQISEGEKDYRIIASRASAEADFDQLFRVGNVQARCYALAGIHSLNRKRFEVLSAILRNSTIKVHTVHTGQGCIISDRPVTDVLSDIEAGKYSR